MVGDGGRDQEVGIGHAVEIGEGGRGHTAEIDEGGQSLIAEIGEGGQGLVAEIGEGDLVVEIIELPGNIIRGGTIDQDW